MREALCLTKSFIFQIAGARVIIDVEGQSLNQIIYITPSFAKMVVDFIQKCLPLRLKSIHIVNQSFIFNMGFAIFKPFLEVRREHPIITTKLYININLLQTF